MDWKEHIHSDPEIGFGKPILRGTRIKVEFVLKLMGAGWSAERIAEEFPGVEAVHLQAAAAFAADLMGDEDYAAIGKARAA
ncbi:DUF433 domain-containing protein [Novosphingobium sp. AAP93]|uniref:DUF433 domain-containing protein n=1 Tax=Novosphingobium sp. AAP93 TaxID=1523427 RepID=UPI0006B9D167|nr:DUF433 domain-containing protein [Novosphingobium sp. AAP93]KPF89555.1 hypothetical protein IP83_02035 [Novosphingobium sp. AAP93]